MNNPQLGFMKILTPLITVGIVISAVLAAMSSSAGIQGSGRTLLAIGTVTEPVNGGGNIVVVSGTPYSASGAVIQIDGHSGARGQIHKGDVVSLAATESSDGGTASVSQLAFNGSVQGKVSGVDAPASSLFVLGQTVHVTSQTVFGANAKSSGLAGLRSGETVEVSGFANSVGEWVATHIESKGQTNVSHIVGSVQTLDTTRHTFYINALKIDYGNAQVAGLTDHAQVTVQGVKFAADGTLMANQVQVFPAVKAQPGTIGRIQGLITSFPSSAYFEVNGQPVAVGPQTGLKLAAPLGIDVEVTVTGTFDMNNVLVADSVQT
jgi:hypothetical protein